jgi:uncharacterized protein (DUF2267 family)
MPQGVFLLALTQEDEMQHDEFIGQVQARAQLSSRGDAERATRAVLETLRERIPAATAANLGAQLPQEIGLHLQSAAALVEPGTAERFDLGEFIARVSELSGADEPAATYQARVVLEVVGEAVGASEMEKVRGSLPPDLASLIDSGSSGGMTVG